MRDSGDYPRLQSNRRVQHQRIVDSLTPCCRSCGQFADLYLANNPSRCHPGARLFCGEKEAQHSLGGDAPSHLCVLTLPSWSTTLICRPAETCLACEPFFRVTQHMHVLYSFLTPAYSGLRLCCVPLWGTEIQGAGMWRPTYMKSCFSDGCCICSLAFLSRCLSVFCRSPETQRNFQFGARLGAWNKQEGSGEGTGSKAQGTCLTASADRCIRQLQW